MRAMCAISTAVSALMCTFGWRCLQPAEHLGVVLEPRAHVEPAHDVKLAHVRIRRGFRVHLIHRVAIRARFLRQSRVRAEDARLAKDADVGRIDVLVRREVHACCRASPRWPRSARCPTPSMSGVSKSVRPSAAVEPRARCDLRADRAQRRIRRDARSETFAGTGISAYVALDGERDVVAAEAEAVAQRGRDVAMARAMFGV